MSKKHHFICTVKDSLNKYEKIGSVWCDAKTPFQAKQQFKKNDFIKRFLGKKRYQIVIRQEQILLQASE